MIELETRYLDAVREADSPVDLHESVQHAIELEFATMPPYLTAMMSLDPQRNSKIRGILSTVAVDEMLHMLLCCNLLVALGGTPNIATTGFVPSYPSKLPMAVSSGLVVGVERFSMDVVERTFMGIEHPEDPLQFPGIAEEPTFATIGAFYAALEEKLTQLGDSAFRGDTTGQLLSDSGFEFPRLVPIVDVTSASYAIGVIVREGEGTQTSPKDAAGQVAHYYRFEQIIKGKELVTDSTVPQGFSFTGPEIPYDPAGVLPITANQRLSDLDLQSEAGQKAMKFAQSLTDLLTALHKTFAGDLAAFDPAFDLMFALKRAGQDLCKTEILVDGQPTGRNAGPTWQFLPADP
ncbi:ferritin-like protein [Mycobacterium sp. NPDC050441]|uniref:ferritin-like domain-containing protein n=1 Tax=Mycobacterium sp. NPDC050441 TaxID=3155403 RepID=UPI0033E36BA6